MNQPNGNNKTIQDEFDWTIGSGSTFSWYTGPSTDHTTSSALGKSSRKNSLELIELSSINIVSLV